MKKLWSVLMFLGLTVLANAQTDQERCLNGAIDGSVLCLDVVIRDFNLWDNPGMGLSKHSDFENFANTRVPHTDPASHGCGNTPKTNRDFLEGASVSTDPVIAEWAQTQLGNPAIADAPLKYGEASDGTRGFLIELQRDGKNNFKWDQDVTITKGMVGNTLNGEGNPVKIADACDNSNFDQWFNDVNGVNIPVNDFMVLEKIRDNGLSKTYQISSNGYFPLDKYHGDPNVLNFGKQAYQIWCGEGMDQANSTKCNAMKTGVGFDANDPSAHNYGYTMEGEVKFAYHGGEVFTFSGDDDMWIFIDGNLVADIGGVHLPGPQTVNMDYLASVFGWQLHTDHTLKFFYADRQTDGSNLIITTTLNDVGISENLPPLITKAYTTSGNFNSIIVYSNTPLSEGTLSGVSNGSAPNFLHSNTGVNPVVTGIKALERKPEDVRLGYPYEVFVSANRPNADDSIAFNPGSEVQIIGTNNLIVDRLLLQKVEFLFVTTPKPPVKVESPNSINPLPIDPQSPAITDAIYGEDNGNNVPGATTSKVGTNVPINRGAELVFIPADFGQTGSDLLSKGQSNAQGNFEGNNGNWGMIGNPAAPGVVTSPASGASQPTVNCKVAGDRHTCFDFQFVIRGSFRINMYMYDHLGQYIRQYSQYVTKGALDSLRSLSNTNGAIIDANGDGIPEVKNADVAVNLGLYPLAYDGRLLANGVYIITYDILEYPEETQTWEGGVENGNIVNDFSQPNRTIITVRKPYRRSP